MENRLILDGEPTLPEASPDTEALRQEVEKILAAGWSTVAIDNALFGPGGLFSRAAPSREEWQSPARSELFRETRWRITRLHFKALGLPPF